MEDLWSAVRNGSLADAESALAAAKKIGVNVNARNFSGLAPIHIATWRNHIPILKALISFGSDLDARDAESGWTGLHRALHFGHLAAAAVLILAGASLAVEDSKFRIPVDLLSSNAVTESSDSVSTEVYSWGSGANYQLGTGNERIQKLPCKLEAFHGSVIKAVSAAKFHSVAVTSRGEVFTWGFGRGGRLGHPDFDIHSGQAAVITPRQVISGLGFRRVKAIAAAKHHTVVATEAGEVFTWGSNREGQLGYTSVDTQATPRRVSSLRSRIVGVAVANKHTAVVSEAGEVFTWGCNREGQLGYGTSNSASNYTPRVVESLKGKVFKRVSAAKYHTLVLGVDGEVYTWGHRLVNPKRVVIGRNLKKSGGTTLKFHRMERLHVVSVAAGMVHSLALTDDGALFYWLSSDPDHKCQQLYSFYGQNIVCISAGKYWGAVATNTGNVYTWDGKNGIDKPLVATRLHGVKRVTSVSVGETHLLVIGSLYHPVYPPDAAAAKAAQKQKSDVSGEVNDLNEYLLSDETDTCTQLPETDQENSKRVVPSLKSLCEKVAAEHMVEPRNAIQLLEIADTLGAHDLKKYCEDIVIRNLDYIFTVSLNAIVNTSLEVLAELEKVMDQRSSEPWSRRRLPTPTATFPAIINAEGEASSESEVQRSRDYHAMMRYTPKSLDSFLMPRDDSDLDVCKQIRALRKKLQQIEMLEAKQSDGCCLDDQQIAKLQTRITIESSLAELGAPVATHQVNTFSSVSADGKGNRNPQLSKKQRRKSKPSSGKMEILSSCSSGTAPGSESTEDFKGSEIPRIQKHQEEETSTQFNQYMKEEKVDLDKCKSPSPTTSKKKNRKGGLSMFLSGALDDTPKDIAPPPPPTPKREGPVWGGATFSKGKGLASLREIQSEQKKTVGTKPTSSISSSKDREEEDVAGDGKIRLSSFISSKPIPMASSGSSSQAQDGERGSTPLWQPSGTPSLSRTSLRDIQMQQVKKHQNLSQSPKSKVAGFCVSSPTDSPGMNRWFKPEVDATSSLRSIQIEEKAIKDLKRFYTTVKIVRNQS